MPRNHKKPSKRQTCRKKYKIVKKVAAHNKKIRRELKNNKKKGKPKDPGVPNSFPFKAEILKEAEQRKQRINKLKEAQKQSRLKLQMENRGLSDLLADAEKRDSAFEKRPIKAGEVPKQGSENFKSYYSDLKKVIEKADVVLEVLDARDPLGSRCPQLEELVINERKRLVLLLNKIDLIPRSNLYAWLTYLQKELPTVAFKASTQSQFLNLCQVRNIAVLHMPDNLKFSKHCVGANHLMKVLGNYCRNQNIRGSIKVGVVGFPNVGKSSVLNSLKRSRSCHVGATPGITKHVQEVFINKHVTILDSPGVIFAKDGSSATLALRNAVKVETLNDVIPPAEAILQRADHTQLCLHYCVPQFSDVNEFLSMLAKRKNLYKKKGLLNVEAAARDLINDWNSGRIKYYTHPPEDYKPSLHVSAEYVEEMGKAFDVSSMDQKNGLDEVPIVFPSDGVVTKLLEPTEGLLIDNAVDDDGELLMDDREEMQIDYVEKEKFSVTMPEAKKYFPVAKEEKLIPDEFQQNRKIKRMMKKRKRLEKRKKKFAAAAPSLSYIKNPFSLE